MKEFMRARAPRLFGVLRDTKDRVLLEYRVVKHLSPSQLVRVILPVRASWKEALPIQRPLVHRVSLSNHAAGLVESLEAAGVELAHGGHTAYLAPQVWRRSPLAGVASRYPADAGLKIVRQAGGIGDGRYLLGDSHSHLQLQLLHETRHLVLVANLLHDAGLGPRLYDLAELQSGDAVWTAYVIEHVAGVEPDHAQWADAMSRIRSLEHLRVVVPDGFAHSDFRSPDCNGNARCDESGRFLYFDFQNFVLHDFDRYLIDLVRAAAKETHFGDRSVLRGGSYLYQSIPGVPLPAKRDIQVRTRVIERLLGQAGASVAGRVVLDIGCNLGMMMGQYLAMGAHWCVGWDLESFLAHSQRVLLATGCTRFSLRGGFLKAERPIDEEIPTFLRAHLDGCAVSYLAIRRHVGWLPALGRIPWTHLLYEGHEGETRADTLRFVEELQSIVPCSIAAIDTYRDGDSDERVVAILRR